MLIKYLREDQYGNPVKVEIWRDDQSGNFVRIKRLGQLGTVPYRSDIYMSENVEQFKEALAEEITSLMGYQDALEKVLTLPKIKPEKADTYVEDEHMERLRNAVMCLPRD